MPVRLPLTRPWTREACLRRDQEAIVRMQRLADQFLRYVRPVAIGRVDEVDTELWQTPQGGQRGRTIPRRAPDAFACDPHGAVPKAIDGAVADLESTGGAGVD